ncbi:EamA family transporter [Chloroflexota bacterium]
MNKRDKIIGRAFAVGAALAYGAGSVLIRRVVADVSSPLVGAAIALLSGTMVLAVIAAVKPETNLKQKKGAVGILLLSGVATGLGSLSSYFALSMAPVVVVTPLQSTSPLFALMWSSIFLNRLEKITLRVVLGVVLVMAGIALIAIGRID